MTKKNFTFIIYFLSSILVLVLSLFVYRFTMHICYLNLHDQITTPKYTGERVSKTYSAKLKKIATFINTTNESSIKGLSNADLILEFLSKSNGLTYKAMFSQESAKNVSSIINLKDYCNSYLPILKFSNNVETKALKGINATSIFISFNEDSSSNFLYQNGEYYHYRSLNIDNDNNTPVKLTNVIVQFVHGNIVNDETLASSESYGTGLLFCSGKAQDIKWDRKNNSKINITDRKGDPISLMPGPTWWTFIDETSSIAYD
ncbi:DUF3048 C-terminal domain-containing protein [Clostridium estertheticum]|uniref:DUF3048 C-terminal domain-containing protein n=1 Tax=Clostridium estertheticum TaxID=238834 RepID=UPI0013EE7CFC|nr:DUF3048 C-terminal domain-containing protein [Clostridium estertheticum]MBZ9609483.1 DUF3048 C-terminal domain-containing protein [Clostridium estertheticum]